MSATLLDHCFRVKEDATYPIIKQLYDWLEGYRLAEGDNTFSPDAILQIIAPGIRGPGAWKDGTLALEQSRLLDASALKRSDQEIIAAGLFWQHHNIAEAKALLNTQRKLVICGPSGTGKTTISYCLIHDFTQRFPDHRTVFGRAAGQGT